MVETFLFDVDGTLLDTRDFIVKATKYSLHTHGFDVPESDETIYRLVGKDFDEFYFKLTGEKENKYLQETHIEFQLSNTHLVTPFPDTFKTLEKLKENNFKLAVITSRTKRTSVLTLKQASLLDFFDVIISREDTGAIKPNPEPLFLAMDKINSKPESSVMVGDSYLDVEAGVNAGTKTVRVMTGFHHDRLNNPEPDFIIQSLKEILKIRF